MHFFHFLKALLMVFFGGGWSQSQDNVPSRIRRHMRYVGQVRPDRLHFPGSRFIMPFFYLFENLFAAMGAIWQETDLPVLKPVVIQVRPSVRFLSGGWKYLVIVPLFLVAVGYAVRQCYVSFQEKPPDWLSQKERSTPSLTGLNRPDAPWRQFGKLLEQAQMQARRDKLPLNDVQFFELGKKAGEIIVWHAENVVNPGFGPLTRIERAFGMEPVNLIGFYTAEGKPIAFTVKSVAGKPKSFWVTIHIEKPLAPSESMILVRKEKQKHASRPNPEGKFTFGLGRLGGPANTIQARGIRIPEGGALTGYTPQSGVNVTLNDTPTVNWVNTLVDQPGTPLSVTFTSTQWKDSVPAPDRPPPPKAATTNASPAKAGR